MCCNEATFLLQSTSASLFAAFRKVWNKEIENPTSKDLLFSCEKKGLFHFFLQEKGFVFIFIHEFSHIWRRVIAVLELSDSQLHFDGQICVAFTSSSVKKDTLSTERRKSLHVSFKRYVTWEPDGKLSVWTFEWNISDENSQWSTFEFEVTFECINCLMSGDKHHQQTNKSSQSSWFRPLNQRYGASRPQKQLLTP